MVWKDLKLHRKTSKQYELRFTKDGVCKDITGWSIYLVIKESIKDSDQNAKIFKTITTHLDPLNGKTLIGLDKSETDFVGNYYYSLDYKDTDGNEDVLFSGRIKFVDTVIKNRQ